MKRFRTWLPCPQAWFGGFLLAFFLVTGLIYAPSWHLNGLLLEYVHKAPIFAAAFAGFTVALELLIRRPGVMLRKQTARADGEKRLFWTVFAVLTCVWAVYIGAFFPGTASIDGYYQIDLGLGLLPMDDHHPYIVTMYYAWLFRLGRWLGGHDRFGLFAIVAVQALLTSYACGKTVVEIRRMGFGRVACVLTTLFYGGFPLIGVYVQTVIKDSLYFPVFMLYFLQLLRVYRQLTEHQGHRFGALAHLALLGLLVCFIRHDGVIVVAGSLAVLALVSLDRRGRRRLLLLTLAVVLAFGGYQTSVKAIMSTSDASFGTSALPEMLSLMFQMTAVYMRTYPDKVTAEEFAAINKVLDGEKLIRVFDPLLADPVKNTFRNDCTTQDLIDYFVVWVKMFFKHPACYVDGLLHCTFGYIYPFFLNLHDNFYVQTSTNEKVIGAGLDIFHVNTEGLMKFFIDLMYGWADNPWLNWMMSPGTYTWFGLVLFLLLWAKKKRRALAVFTAPALVMAIAVISPVNGNTRYVLACIAVVPILLCWTLRQTAREREALPAA